MLIHERFVFVHLQRTGGSFIAETLNRALPAGSLARGAPGTYHPGWEQIPPEACERPVLVYVRNPWDWYVSWYHAMLERRPERPLFQLVAGDGSRDFKTAVRNVCSLASYRDHPMVGARIRDASPSMEAMLEGHDLYTARLLSLLGPGLDSEHLTFGRYESLVPDLERFLKSTNVTLDDDALNTIRSAEPVNASSGRRPYRDYYDEELREIVGDSCSLFTERFQYRF